MHIYLYSSNLTEHCISQGRVGDEAIKIVYKSFWLKIRKFSLSLSSLPLSSTVYACYISRDNK
jgi:hypothetical protein